MSCLAMRKTPFILKALEQEGAAQRVGPVLLARIFQIVLHQGKMFNQVLNVPLAFHVLESSTSQHKQQEKTDRAAL